MKSIRLLKRLLGICVMGGMAHGMVVSADTGKLSYYPGDETADIYPVGEAAIDSNGQSASSITIIKNQPVLIYDPGTNGFEQRVVYKFQIPALKELVESRLVVSAKLVLKLTDNKARLPAEKRSVEVFVDPDTGGGQITAADFNAGSLLGVILRDGDPKYLPGQEMAIDVTDFVNKPGWVSFRLQFAGAGDKLELDLQGSQETPGKASPSSWQPHIELTLAKQIFTMRGESPDPGLLTDFDDASQWHVATVKGAAGAEVKIETSKDVTFFGKPVVKVCYANINDQAEITLTPKNPMPVPGVFDAAELWAWANSFNYGIQRKLVVTLEDAQGHKTVRELTHALNHLGPLSHFVNYDLPWEKFDGKKKYELKAITIKNFAGSPKKDFFYLGPLSFYVRNTKSAPAKSDDEIRLPSCAESMVPPVKADNGVEEIAPGKFVFTATSSGDTVKYSYTPCDGTMDDIAITHNGQTFKPMNNGGVVFSCAGKDTPCKAALKNICFDKQNKTLRTEWSQLVEDAKGNKRPGSAYTMAFSLINKSLVIDLAVAGNGSTGFSFGSLSGMHAPSLLEIPYFCFWGRKNGVLGPRIVHSPGTFYYGMVDHYFSGASDIYADSRVDGDGNVFYNGGAYYYPDTDGKKHPVKERIILTASRELQDVLPSIPNPVLFDQKQAKNYYFAGTNWPDTGLIKKFHDLGMEDLFVWIFWWNAPSDNPVERKHCGVKEGSAWDSWTYDVINPKDGSPSPKVWREVKPEEYIALIHGFGYKFGLYTYYNDIPSTSKFFNRDWLALENDGQYRMGCLGNYSVKPSSMQAYQKELSADIIKNFGRLDGTYCDVVTCRPYWGGGTDFDARAPGAGKLSSFLRGVAQLCHQEIEAFGQTWSEGHFQWLYARLMTGSYGTMFTLNPKGASSMPMLPEFSLRRINPLSQSIGMSPSPHDFFGRSGRKVPRQEFRNEFTSQFNAALMGYGHMSYTLAWDFCYQTMFGVAKRYYQFKEIQKLYAFEPIEQIEYFNGGKYVGTSAAIEDKSYLQGRLRKVYKNGLVVYVNYNGGDPWAINVDGNEITLPPWGFYAVHKPSDTLSCSTLKNGLRCEYSRSSKYVYADSWNHPMEFDGLRMNGAGVVKRLGERKISFIPLGQDTTLDSPEDFGVKEVGIDLAYFFPALKNAGDATSRVKVEAVTKEGKSVSFPHAVDKGWLTLRPKDHNISYTVELE